MTECHTHDTIALLYDHSVAAEDGKMAESEEHDKLQGIQKTEQRKTEHELVDLGRHAEAVEEGQEPHASSAPTATSTRAERTTLRRSWPARCPRTRRSR